MIDFQKARKKPVVVEAYHMRLPKDAKALAAMIPGAFVRGDYGNLKLSARLVIPTLEGNHEARLGDWIIRGVAGEYYPIKNDIFAATYDLVTDGESE